MNDFETTVRAVALRLGLAAAAVAGPAAAARAEDSAAATELEEVEVVGHYGNGVGVSDAASAGYVTSEVIDQQPRSQPGEIMESIPGMIVTQHSGPGKANQYFLRGFNLDHGTDFQTSLDGVPLNLPTHAHGQGYTDLNFLIPELVSRVDYYKGPYGAAQGDFATAGSADIHYADHLEQGTATLTGGSHEYARALLTGGPAVGAARMVYGVELSNDRGPFDNPENHRTFNGVLRLTGAAGAGEWSVSAMAYDTSWNATDQIPSRAVAEGLIGRDGAIDPTDGGQSHRYSLSGSYQRPLWGGRIQSNLYTVDSHLDLYSNFTYFLAHPAQGDQFNQRDDRRVYGWNGSWLRPATLFGMSAVNTIGWDIRQDRLDPVGLYDTVARQPFLTVSEDRVRQSSYALYAENRLQWLSWLRSVAGFRVAAFHYRVDSSVPQNSGSRGAGTGLPKLSLIFGPWARTELFVNAGEGFHSNDGRGATAHLDAQGNAVGQVTPLVRAKGAEAGLRTELVPGLQSSLSLWYLHLDSELVFDGDVGTTVPGQASRRTGVEWSNQYAAARWLRLDLDLAYTHPRLSDGTRIPEALERAAGAGITLHDMGPWAAGLSMRYFGPRALTSDNSVRSPSTLLFNGQASWACTPRLRLRLDVLNLFNRRADEITYYYVSRLPGEPAAGVPDSHFHPAESRAFRLSAILSF